VRRLLLLVAALAAVSIPGSSLAAGGPGDGGFGYGGSDPLVVRALARCEFSLADPTRYRSCATLQLLQLIVSTHDPASQLPRIDDYAHTKAGWLEQNCHTVMHTVGREYVRRERITLETLFAQLPRTNDPGCSAGFTHGMLAGLGSEVFKLGPEGAVERCRRSPTRYQRYSCVHGLGHAYARTFSEAIDPSLAACGRLGRDAPDCAQGVFHDYWIAAAGLDGTKLPRGGGASPRALCTRQPVRYAYPCWYRSFLERPPARAVTSASRLLGLCRGLAGAMRHGCIAGASVIRSSDPFDQMDTCVRLHGGDAVACARGVRVPAVALAPRDYQLRLIRRCGAFGPTAQSGCYRWLGTALNVITDGRFARTGCPRLGAEAARTACLAGAKGYEGPLQTFS
jgi:hypothetical protein